MRFCAIHAWGVTSPLAISGSCHADDLGCAGCVKAVDAGDADLDFSGLAVGVSCRDAFRTYVSDPEGWPYVSSIIDLFQRRVVGWSIKPTMTAQLVTTFS